jgi:peptidoglycan/LPS O-acetylase OafA/YrhL
MTPLIITLAETHSKPTIRFYFLDSLRGLFAILVIIDHLLLYALGQSDLIVFMFNGLYLGVTGFFVLSAFLLTHKMLQDIFKIRENLVKNAALLVVQYFVRRFFRVYLPFVVYVTLVKCVDDVFGGVYIKKKGFKPNPGFFTSWLDLVLLKFHGNNHIWTLPVELKFYFVLPVICVAAFASRKHFNTFVLVSCGLNLIYFDYWNRMSPEKVQFADKFLSTTPVFFNGTLLGVLYFKYEQIKHSESNHLGEVLSHRQKLFSILIRYLICTRNVIQKNALFAFILNQAILKKTMLVIFSYKMLNFLVGCLSSVLFLAGFYKFSTYFYDLDSIYSSYFSSVCLCLFLFLMLISQENFFKNIFNDNYALRKLGNYSFGIFLFHPMCMLIKPYYFDKLGERKPPVSNLEIVIATILLSHCCGWLFYHTVQTPFMKMGDFASRKIKDSKYFK